MRTADCFMDLLAYVTYFLKTVKERQPAFEQVKADIDRLVSMADTCLRETGISNEDFDHARFAVFAWVDEAILNSPWNGKNQWQMKQLQRTYYKTTDAGEIFFTRLNSLGPHQNHVREVYYLCLAMGFKGRYVHEGDDFLLEQLKTSNLKVIMGSSIGLPALDKGQLFSQAYPRQVDRPEPQQHKKGFSPIHLVGIAFPIVLYAALFFIYRFILNNIGENLLSLVP